VGLIRNTRRVRRELNFLVLKNGDFPLGCRARSGVRRAERTRMSRKFKKRTDRRRAVDEVADFWQGRPKYLPTRTFYPVATKRVPRLLAGATKLAKLCGPEFEKESENFLPSPFTHHLTPRRPLANKKKAIFWRESRKGHARKRIKIMYFDTWEKRLGTDAYIARGSTRKGIGEIFKFDQIHYF